MASFYLEKVLYKEALAGIFQSFTGQSYEVADIECGCTEQLSLVMAAKKGAELCKFKLNDKHFLKWRKKTCNFLNIMYPRLCCLDGLNPQD